MEASRTPLRFKSFLDLVCPEYTYSETIGNHRRGVRVVVRREGGPSLQLEQNHKGAPVLYEAHATEKRGRVTVLRTVRGHLGAGALGFTQSLDGATFTTAGPFSGKATYLGRRPPIEARPGKGTWRGTLKVDFPGYDAVPLAGPSFTATIVSAMRTESQL